MDRYNFKVVEKKWQSHWEKNESFKTSIDTNRGDNNNLEGYIPPTPLSNNEVINPYLIGSVQNVIENCNTSVVPFRDNRNNIVGTVSEDLENYDLDCPICFDPLDTSDVITMDCCKKQLHLCSILKQNHYQKRLLIK